MVGAVLETAATVTVSVTGPFGPWATMVKVCTPSASPPTAWLPAGVVLASPGPVTATAVACALDQATVTVAGASAAAGEAPIQALTDDAAVTVSVADRVTGPPGPWATRV